MRFTNSLKVTVVLFAFLLIGCGEVSDSDSEKPKTLNELIEEAHFAAKELHFNMLSGADHEFNVSIFESVQSQLNDLKTKVEESDVTQDKKAKLVRACESLIENFGRVTSGSAEYQKRFSAADAELLRQIRILEQTRYLKDVEQNGK